MSRGDVAGEPRSWVVSVRIVRDVIKPFVSEMEAAGVSAAKAKASVIAGLVNSLVPFLVDLTEDGFETMLRAFESDLRLQTAAFRASLVGVPEGQVIQ
jgi:hypothetical protein